MEGEFTSYCRQYYSLQQLLAQQETQFNTLLANALPYTGQTNITELDAIIKCNRKVQQARAEADNTIAEKRQTEQVILQIMAYFEVSPNTELTCEIPGEAELMLWADEENDLYCIKTKDLAPLEDDLDIITIHMNDNRYSFTEDDDD